MAKILICDEAPDIKQADLEAIAKPVTNETRENVNFENAFEVANIEVGITGYIRTSFNIYPGGSFSTLKAIYKLDNGSEQTVELTYSEYSYYLYISNLTDYNSMSIKYEYYYDDKFVGSTDYYTIDLTELDKTYDYGDKTRSNY